MFISRPPTAAVTSNTKKGWRVGKEEEEEVRCAAAAAGLATAPPCGEADAHDDGAAAASLAPHREGTRRDSNSDGPGSGGTSSLSLMGHIITIMVTHQHHVCF